MTSSPLVKRQVRIRLILIMIITGISLLPAQEWQSSIVYFDSSLRLTYVADGAGNRIPDFSYAGFRNGAVPIPIVPTVMTISPVAGDNTSHIQSAIDAIGALTPDSTGFRGALMLTAGRYDVFGTLYLRHSGVVLRGVGDDEDSASNTVIKGRGNSPAQRTILVAGGGSTTYWRDEIPGSRSDIITDTVFVGSRHFRVADPSLYHVGDNIIIYHPCTDAWLQAVDYGATATDTPWTVGEQPIVYNRYIVGIAADTITIDAPVFNHLIRSLSQPRIYRYARTGLKTLIGIEDLRVDIETAGGTDENHAWNAIDLYQLEDAWVNDCTVLHFGLSGIRCNTATRITVDHCRALDPISIITGGNRYNFNIYTGSQLILFNQCHAREGRHHYVSNGTSWTSGCVFLDCISEGAWASSEGHRRWTTGLLYDNLREIAPHTTGGLLCLYNRGDYGTGHGWASAHSVAWNCNEAGHQVIIQKPPTAQNYAIGCFGQVNGNGPYSHPAGYIEGSNQSGLHPRSLYLAQLNERLHPPIDVDLIVAKGWNLISLPAHLPNTLVSSLFQSAASPAIFFSAGEYISAETLRAGIGYWMKFDSVQRFSLRGYAATDDTVEIAAGWNLVGAPSHEIPVHTIATEPPGILLMPAYTYDRKYSAVDTLRPGGGYWIKSASAGKIILRIQATAETNMQIPTARSHRPVNLE